MFKKFTLAILAVICTVFLVSCKDGKGEKNNDTPDMTVGENGVGELITPDEDSDEYSLGSYRYDKNKIKLYYEDADIPTELMTFLSDYFLCFENDDFEGYKNALAQDYADRYNEYLLKNYSSDGEEYGLEQSFELQCRNLKDRMLYEIYGSTDEKITNSDEGNFKITRIRAEKPTLKEGETQESLIKGFFSYLNEVFDMDYYSYATKEMDKLEYLTLFVIAKDDNGNEHKILNEVDIVFAEKDGKYYTYG